ncbi:aspartyl-phosphate phosphatase Spo0E family protein [Microbacteriaceae bacterium 4G12]
MWEQVIEKKRKKMKYFANRYGMTAKKTVACSQELDKLLNIVLFLQVHDNIKSQNM